MAKSLSSAGHKTAKTASSTGRNVRLGDAKARFELASGPSAKGGGAKFEIASNTGGQGWATTQGGNGIKYGAEPAKLDRVSKTVTPGGSLNIGSQSQKNAKYEVATPLAGTNKIANTNQVAK